MPRTERPKAVLGRARAAGCGLVLLLAGAVPAGAQITGRVFADYNGNGTRNTSTTAANDSGNGTVPAAFDAGFAGIAVTAYDAAGTNCGSTTTAANGTYSLAIGGGCAGTQFRVEFTGLPAGVRASARSTDSVDGSTAATAGSRVQFVTSGTVAEVNLALNRPPDYCQDFPPLVTTCYTFGDQVTGPNAGAAAVVSFPYTAGSAGCR